MSILVLGAGMAGLAAAHALSQADQNVMVLEAKDRLGGRTYTNRDFAKIPVEFGAEFIHGDRVATWELVRALGLETVHWNKLDDSLIRLEDGAWLTMREARLTHPELDLTRSWAIPELEALQGEDWGSYLGRIGFTQRQLRYVKRSFANATGEAMRFLSARAMLAHIHERGEESGVGDYRLLSGYDTLVAALAEGLNIRSGDPVIELVWGEEGVRALALSGEVYSADAAIVSVPLGVLQTDTIHFVPELSGDKRAALLGLRMGPIIKLIYGFDEAPLDPSIMAVYSRLNPPMWWSPSYGQRSDVHVWTAFVSGDWAVELLSLGEAGALEAGLTSFRQELSRPDLVARSARLVNWPDDPYTRGGYSFVLPGHDGARERLAAPTPPLYWAGEATAPEHRAATVHGALLSGRRAAAEVLAGLDAPLDTPTTTTGTLAYE